MKKIFLRKYLLSICNYRRRFQVSTKDSGVICGNKRISFLKISNAVKDKLITDFWIGVTGYRMNGWEDRK